MPTSSLLEAEKSVDGLRLHSVHETPSYGIKRSRSQCTVIAEIFVKISYSSVRRISYAINFRTARTVSHTLVYVHGLRVLQHFVLSAKSTKSTKLNRVRKYLRLQYLTLWACIVRFRTIASMRRFWCDISLNFYRQATKNGARMPKTSKKKLKAVLWGSSSQSF